MSRRDWGIQPDGGWHGVHDDYSRYIVEAIRDAESEADIDRIHFRLAAIRGYCDSAPSDERCEVAEEWSNAVPQIRDHYRRPPLLPADPVALAAALCSRKAALERIVVEREQRLAEEARWIAEELPSILGRPLIYGGPIVELAEGVELDDAERGVLRSVLRHLRETYTRDHFQRPHPWNKPWPVGHVWVESNYAEHVHARRLRNWRALLAERDGERVLLIGKGIDVFAESN